MTSIFILQYSVYDNDDDDDDDDVRKKTKQATESLWDPRIVIQPGEPALLGSGLVLGLLGLT